MLEFRFDLHWNPSAMRTVNKLALTHSLESMGESNFEAKGSIDHIFIT